MSSCTRKRASSIHRRFNWARSSSHDSSMVTGFPLSRGMKSMGCLVLFLLQLALRVEVADAAALAAGSRIQHRVDQGRLAGIHRRVHGALQFIRGCRVNADAAESFHHLVVARALDEYGRRWIRADRVDVGAAINAVIVED